MRHAWVDKLSELRACREAIAWASDYESLEAAWAACERGDWMLWLLGRLSGATEIAKRKAMVLCACACARTALRFAKDNRVLLCIETAERWARDEASIDEVRAASRAAADAYAAAAADAAAYAADAAAYAAADAAYAAADAAYAAAAYAAYAAAYAADAAYADARTSTLKACADIVREHYPVAPSLSVTVRR